MTIYIDRRPMGVRSNGARVPGIVTRSGRLIFNLAPTYLSAKVLGALQCCQVKDYDEHLFALDR